MDFEGRSSWSYSLEGKRIRLLRKSKLCFWTTRERPEASRMMVVAAKASLAIGERVRAPTASTKRRASSPSSNDRARTFLKI